MYCSLFFGKGNEPLHDESLDIVRESNGILAKQRRAVWVRGIDQSIVRASGEKEANLGHVCGNCAFNGRVEGGKWRVVWPVPNRDAGGARINCFRPLSKRISCAVSIQMADDSRPPSWGGGGVHDVVVCEEIKCCGSVVIAKLPGEVTGVAGLGEDVFVQGDCAESDAWEERERSEVEW